MRNEVKIFFGFAKANENKAKKMCVASFNLEAKILKKRKRDSLIVEAKLKKTLQARGCSFSCTQATVYANLSRLWGAVAGYSRLQLSMWLPVTQVIAVNN
jgi:virulence-associated protein VapD